MGFKYSGLVAPDDELHRVVDESNNMPAAPPVIAPTQVKITVTNPPPTRDIYVNQYAPNKTGYAGYNPATDCDGNFMSFKFQPNNNCYAYSCDFSSNSFAQPGRMHGNLITPATLNGPDVQSFAEKDGLIAVGTTITDIKKFDLERKWSGGVPGHFVALMISPADSPWGGDYHWARCDDPVNFASWSQKDGKDQVTNFDFAGNLISDPSKANWTVNQGPQGPRDDPNSNDMLVTYKFFSFMFVPWGSVSII